MQEKLLKGSLAGLGTVIAYYLDNISTLVWLLVIFEASDYITGILAAIKSNGLSSGQAIWGFIKKICYFFLVGVGFGVDYIIVEATGLVGLEFNYPDIFGILSVCYLLSTEAISILENIGEFGVKVPFLSSFIKIMREKIIDKGGMDE